MIVLQGGDINDFLNDHVPDLRCPLCAHDKFATSDEDSAGAMLTTVPLELPQERDLGHRPTLPVIWMSCVQCGHVLLLSRKRIEKWTRERDR